MYVHTAADVWRTGNPSSTLSFIMNCIRSFIEQGNKDSTMSSYWNVANGYGTVGQG